MADIEAIMWPRGWTRGDLTAMAAKFTFGGLVVRVLVALGLVFATYNPSSYSYYHWLKETTVNRNFGDLGPWIAMAGIILLIVWVIFLRATLRSLGFIGLILAFAFCGILLWLTISIGIVPTDTIKPLSYAILVLFAAILGIGMSWSHVRRRLTGQFDVDETDLG